MKNPLLQLCLIISLCLCSIAKANEDEDENALNYIEKLDDIEVIEQSESHSLVRMLPEQAQNIMDTAEVLKNMAGANVNRNGPLSGIAQYRGLYGDRINVEIDGMKMHESGGNSMDAVMSHVPANMVSAVVLKRGIAPVSSGIETIGGHIQIITKQAEQGDDEMSFNTDLSLGYKSASAGKSASLFASGSSGKHRAYLGLDSENGDSFEFPGGTNFNTEYDKKFYQMGYGLTLDRQQLSFKLNYNDTGNTGTPSLPMDITYIHSGTASSEYQFEPADDTQIITRLSYQNAEHLMKNHQFRLTDTKRESLNNLITRTYGITAHMDRSFGKLSVGFAGDDSNRKAIILDPTNPMFLINNFDTSKTRNSLFLELDKQLNDSLNLISGIRYTQVDMDAADVSSTVAMMSTPMGNLHRTLRDRFNAANRDKSDNNLDVAFNLNQQVSEHINLEYGLAFKNRSPSYRERYLWLPLEATAGLADGFQYLGNLSLKPEAATQFEFGVNYQNDKLSFSPHIFYQQIDDYIQGTATTSTPAPPNTLTFNNVDAELYGLDYELNYQLSERLQLRNITSYVRGKRRDIADNLYRIAPLNTRIELSYGHGSWQLNAEMVAYQAQNNVANTNLEQKTAGYTIFNLGSSYYFNQTANLVFGINNLFDKKYLDHLGGYNRNNLNFDVGFDANNRRANRLPGIGINVFATLYLHF
jgi:iron complex outermembrane receptor protein